jgi:hypothetical protein
MTATISTSASGALIFTATALRMARRASEIDAPIEAAVYHSEFLLPAGDLIDYSLSAVLSAYFSVEAALNELFLVHELGTLVNFKGLKAELARRLFEAWGAGVEKLNPLEKANIAMVVAEAAPIDWGGAYGQRFHVLHDLRNELVHHRPKWFAHGLPASESPDKLRKRLEGQFETAVMWRNREAAYRWNDCLGSDCARWACETAIGFNQQVYAAVGTKFMPPDVDNPGKGSAP